MLLRVAPAGLPPVRREDGISWSRGRGFAKANGLPCWLQNLRSYFCSQFVLSKPRLCFSCAEAGHEHGVGELQGCKIALILLIPSKKQPLSTTPYLHLPAHIFLHPYRAMAFHPNPGSAGSRDAGLGFLSGDAFII